MNQNYIRNFSLKIKVTYKYLGIWQFYFNRINEIKITSDIFRGFASQYLPVSVFPSQTYEIDFTKPLLRQIYFSLVCLFNFGSGTPTYLAIKHCNEQNCIHQTYASANLFLAMLFLVCLLHVVVCNPPFISKDSASVKEDGWTGTPHKMLAGLSVHEFYTPQL